MKIEEEGDDDVDAYDDSTMVGNWAVSATAIGQREKQQKKEGDQVASKEIPSTW